MTRYLLDTNIVTELEDRRRPGFASVTAKLAKLTDDDEVMLSILAAYEYRHGISKAPAEIKDALLAAWRDFETSFPLVGLSTRGAKLYGELKTQYQKHVGVGDKELKKHTVDFILASSALEHNAVLVSGDRIFWRIREARPALRVENWLTG